MQSECSRLKRPALDISNAQVKGWLKKSKGYIA